MESGYTAKWLLPVTWQNWSALSC